MDSGDPIVWVQVAGGGKMALRKSVVAGVLKGMAAEAEEKEREKSQDKKRDKAQNKAVKHG